MFFLKSRYSYMVINSKFRDFIFIFIFDFFPKSIYTLDFTSADFILIVLYVLLDSSTILSNLSICTFFDIEVLFFKVLINLSATTDFPLFCVQCICFSLPCNHDFIDHNLYLPLVFLVWVWTHSRFLKKRQ